MRVEPIEALFPKVTVRAMETVATSIEDGTNELRPVSSQYECKSRANEIQAGTRLANSCAEVMRMTTIGVLDSDPGVTVAVARRLESLGASIRVLHCSDPKTALDLVEEGRIQVLVTDILGGAFDGLSLVFAARRRRRGLPIVVISAAVDRGDPHGRRLSYRYCVPGSVWRDPELGSAQFADALSDGATSRSDGLVRQHSPEFALGT